jgi:hypothetical protein
MRESEKFDNVIWIYNENISLRIHEREREIEERERK